MHLGHTPLKDKNMYDGTVKIDVEGDFHKNYCEDFYIDKKYHEINLIDFNSNNIYFTVCYSIIKDRIIKWTYIISDMLYDYNEKINICEELFKNKSYYKEYIPLYYGDLNSSNIKNFMIYFWNNKFFNIKNYNTDILSICESKFLDLQIY